MSETTFEQLSRIVRELTAEAEAISSLSLESDLEQVLLQADSYTARLESWKNQVEEAAPFEAESDFTTAQKEAFRAQVLVFQDRHLALTERLSGARDLVTQQMGDLHKRAKALRTYVDRFPSRITIAGKRKG